MEWKLFLICKGLNDWGMVSGYIVPYFYKACKERLLADMKAFYVSFLGFGFRVQGLGSRVQGLGFRVM